MRLRDARVCVTVLQFLPAATLTVLSGLARAGPAPFIAPAVLVPLCGWQLRRSWNRPLFWAAGGGYSAAIAGLAGGAVIGFGLSASAGVVFLALAGAVVFPGLVLGGAALVRRRVLAASVEDLAGSRLEVPFRVAGSGAYLLVGTGTVTLRTRKYRPGVIWRTATTSEELDRLHVLGVRPVTPPEDVELPGLSTVARVRSRAELLRMRTSRARWDVPLAEAGPALELIRLRKEP